MCQRSNSLGRREDLVAGSNSHDAHVSLRGLFVLSISLTCAIDKCLQLSLEMTPRNNWVKFFCAVKRIINISSKAYKLIRQEYSVFLDWFYYHEVVAEFTVRHWTVPYVGCGFVPVARSPTCNRRKDFTVCNAIFLLTWTDNESGR